MLNFPSIGLIDKSLFLESFDKIQQLETVQIISGAEKEQVFQQTISTIKTPGETKSFAFENLLKVQARQGNFYIAQCVIDFGFPPSPRGFPGIVHKYSLQLIGIAKSTIDLGNTFIKPTTKIENFIVHFLHKDTAWVDSKPFNDNYFVSQIRKRLSNKPLVNCF